MAVGTFVLQYRTAPRLSSISTKVALYSAGLLTRDVKPTVLSLPLTLKLSFREIGRPCSGPTSLPVRLRWLSRDLALVMASSKNTSLRQFVYTCELRHLIHVHPTYQLLRCCSALAERSCDRFRAPCLRCDIFQYVRSSAIRDFQLFRREPARLFGP